MKTYTLGNNSFFELYFNGIQKCFLYLQEIIITERCDYLMFSYTNTCSQVTFFTHACQTFDTFFKQLHRFIFLSKKSSAKD